MARARHGQNVWQCSGCGYWSKRRDNVDRHNRSKHGGAAPIIQAYATLIVEPSYQVVPISSLQTSSFQTPAALPVVAQDTAINTAAENKRAAVRSQSDASSSEAEKPFDPIEASISFFQKYSKFIEEGNKLMRLIQQTAGGGVGGEGFFSSPFSVPMQTATAMPLTQQKQQQYVPNTIGYSGNICSKCFNGIISPVPETERPDTFQQRLVELPHDCNGEYSLLFSSESEVRGRRSQAIAMLEDTLFNQVKDWTRGKEIVLEAKKLNYIPQHPYHLITANAAPEARRLLSSVREAGGRIPFNGDDEALRTFLRWCHSSIVIVGTSTDKDSEGSAQEYYSLSIQGQDKGETPAMNISTTTNANASSNITNIAANNNKDHKRSAQMERYLASLRQLAQQGFQVADDSSK
jgi:hypothetical protein